MSFLDKGCEMTSQTLSTVQVFILKQVKYIYDKDKHVVYVFFIYPCII